MPRQAIADTGLLVAYFDRRERHHLWAVAQFDTLRPTLLVTGATLTAALFLLRRYPDASDALLYLVERGALRVALSLGEHVAEVRALMHKYGDTRMSLVDACVDGVLNPLQFDHLAVLIRSDHSFIPFTSPIESDQVSHQISLRRSGNAGH